MKYVKVSGNFYRVDSESGREAARVAMCAAGVKVTDVYISDYKSLKEMGTAGHAESDNIGEVMTATEVPPPSLEEIEREEREERAAVEDRAFSAIFGEW